MTENIYTDEQKAEIMKIIECSIKIMDRSIEILKERHIIKNNKLESAINVLRTLKDLDDPSKILKHDDFQNTIGNIQSALVVLHPLSDDPGKEDIETAIYHLQLALGVLMCLPNILENNKIPIVIRYLEFALEKLNKIVQELDKIIDLFRGHGS